MHPPELTLALEHGVIRAAERQANQLAAILELVTQVSSAGSLKFGCEILARRGEEFAGCRFVAVATGRSRRPCRLQATSGASDVDRAAGFARELEAALEECRLQDSLIHWPLRPERSHATTTTAHRALAQRFPEAAIWGSPLRNHAGDVVGAWLFVDDPERNEDDLEGWLAAASVPIGTALDVLRQANSGYLSRRLREFTRKARLSWAIAAAVAVVLAVVGLTLPATYYVSSDCILQPQTRRFVAAPFDGQLDKCLVKPGDLVDADQVLAHMDGRSLRVELAGLEAEYQRASKERDVNMAAGKVAQSQMALLECERLDNKRQLLARRMEHLDLRTPLAGVILSGDLQRSEGAPVSVGQALFEVAPLEQMICEIAVSEEETRHAQPGQDVTIRLAAFPGVTWTGRLERIHPRSEIRDQKNVFVAEVALENDARLLRPGMKGQAWIATSPRSRGWIWFHKPLEKAARLLSW